MKADFIFASAGAFMTVRIRGEIDHHSAVEIRNGLDTLLMERRPERLYLDLSGVSFMDSSGLGLIMGRYSVMKELGGELVVLDPAPEVMTILKLAGMERLLRIESSPQEAGRPPEAVRQPAERARVGKGRSGSGRKERAAGRRSLIRKEPSA